MNYIKKFVGMDVSKEKIAVAIADEGREPARFWGEIPHTHEAVRKLVKKLGEVEQLGICYEAGPTGYVLYRWLTKMGIHCTVAAPSLIPKRSGDRIKTDRRDALRLAQLFRAGEMTAVRVPDEEDEALRDLTRALEDAKQDQHRTRQRLTKYMLRHHIRQPEVIKTRWTKAYMNWLEGLSFERGVDQVVFREYRHAILECDERIERIEKEVLQQNESSNQAEVIEVLQAFRGISALTAATISHETVDFGRFAHPVNMMSYIGLVPREKSSGETTWRGGLTKTGNSHLRHLLIEAAWSYRHKPVVKGDLKKRLAGLPPEIQALSWKAQNRLHQKYTRLVYQKGKHPNVAIAAVARELAGFIWEAVQSLRPQQAA